VREALRLAKEELKRAEHSIYVSLKYTRTVEVIKGIIHRLINAIDHAVLALLKHAEEQGKIDKVPSLPRQRLEALQQTFAEDKLLQNYVAFYTLLRKIDKASFASVSEYRKGVAMIAEFDGQKVEITIDIITDYFTKTSELVNLILQRIEEA